MTEGLRELLTPDELRAVLAHELAHIANRDALVMTVAELPGTIMMRARGGIMAPLLSLTGLLSRILTLMLSRYRELAADAGCAAITGHPSALASALLKVSESLQSTPSRDLRAAAALSSFNLVAVPRKGRLRDVGGLVGRIIATHPPLRVRLDALHALERSQRSRHR